MAVLRFLWQLPRKTKLMWPALLLAGAPTNGGGAAAAPRLDSLGGPSEI
jgi:hypothetical protein